MRDKLQLFFADTVFSLDEFSKYREQFYYGFTNKLVDILSTVLEKPAEESIETETNRTIKVALNALGSQSGLRGILANWYAMEPYWK